TPTCPTNGACAFAKAGRCCKPLRRIEDASPAYLADLSGRRCSSLPPSGAAWTRSTRWRRSAPVSCWRSRLPRRAPDGREVADAQYLFEEHSHVKTPRQKLRDVNRRLQRGAEPEPQQSARR